MQPKDLIKPKQAEIKRIKAACPPKTFTKEFPLFYAGQIPNMACLLAEGEVVLTDSATKEQVSLAPGDLLGLYHVINSLPWDTTAVILANSKASLIDKATFLELLESIPELEKQLKKSMD